MLTEEEMLKIQQLSAQNPEVDYIIKRLNEESKFMVSQISHEIRNPLTLISSTLQLMESKNPSLTNVKYWSQICSDVNDLIIMLNELSSLNNSDALNISLIDLSTLIHNIATSFETLSYESKNKIFISIHDNALKYIQHYPCDKIKLKQVFTNIMKNAFDVMKEDDFIAISVKLDTNNNSENESYSSTDNDDITHELALNPKNLIITISNNAKPIDPEHIHTLFEPFVSHKNGGTGLGLAISSRIIKAHGGSITVESNISLTSFIITLPVKTEQ